MKTIKNFKNVPETSSNSQASVPVLPLQQGPAASSQGPAASSQGPVASANSDDEDSEHSDEYSAQSLDSGRTVLYPDLYVLIDDEHWAMTPETHKYAAAAGSFCFVTTRHLQFDHYAVCTTIIVPYEKTDDFGNIQGEVPKGVDPSNQRRVGTVFDLLRKRSRNESKKETSCTKGSLS